MTELEGSQLAFVCAGAGHSYSDADLGRCGPGADWKWLGDVHTPECMAHDLAVRGALEKGESRLSAQLQALPKLPGAVMSWVRARVTGK